MGIGQDGDRLGGGGPDSAAFGSAPVASLYAPAAGDGGASCSAISLPPGTDRCPYRAGPRQAQDVWWIRALLALGLACFVGGCIAAGVADKRFYQDPGFLTGPSACARLGFAPRQLGESQESEAADRTGAAGRVRAGVVVLWLVLSLVVPLGVGVLWLRAWARHADRMIWVSVGIHVGSFVTGAIVTFAVGAIPAGAVMLFMAVLVAVLWGCNRREMALCSRLLSVSSHGLQASPGLVGAAVGLWAVMGAVLLTATGFGLAAFANGAAVPNPDLLSQRRLVAPQAGAGAADLVPQGEGYAAIYPDRCELNGDVVPCCSWQTSAGGQFYIFLVSVAAMWAWAALCAARQFVISGVVAQWYYAPAGSAPQGALRATVRHALGPQSGTVTFAGAVLAVIDALREAANSQLRSSDREGAGAIISAILCCVLRCVANLVLSVLEFLCRYSLIQAALTGQSLVEAGKSVTALLRRNLLDAVTVWWMPGAVVGLTSFALAALWGCVVFAAVALTNPGDAGWLAAVGVAALGAVAMAAVLQLLGRLLLDAVDTVFLCWAYDKDAHTATRADVEEVFGAVVNKMKPPGAVITQPGGGYAYGAGQQEGGGGGAIQMQAPQAQAPMRPYRG